MSTPLIAARAVSFGYDDRVVVDRLDLSVVSTLDGNAQRKHHQDDRQGLVVVEKVDPDAPSPDQPTST